MPPFVNNRKRRSPSAEAQPPPKRTKSTASTPHNAEVKSKEKRSKKKKPKVRTVVKQVEKRSTLFDSVDNNTPGHANHTSKFFTAAGAESSNDSSSTTDSDEDDFEDVIPADQAKPGRPADEDEDDDEDEDEEDDDWENALHPPMEDQRNMEAPAESLELNLGGPKAAEMSFGDLTGNKKQGPSKKEKQRRILAHSMHIQYLMWHNHVRNHWLNDGEVQKLMVSHMKQSQKLRVQYDNWKRKSGVATEPKATPKSSGKGKGRKDSKGDPRSERDWGRPAERQAVGQPDMSRGDPLQQLLNVLAAWWKQRFTITAPGLRKRGYKPPKDLRDEIQAWREGESEIRDHGERIATLKEFRSHAKRCEGSRDVGAQLFVALLRGLGIETRMVASLQPLGYGWTKVEEAEPKPKKTTSKGGAESTSKVTKAPKVKKPKAKPKPTGKGSKTDAIKLSDTSDLSELSEAGDEESDSDASIVDITPRRRPNMPYDKDLLFPTYWIEAISSLTYRVFPVDPFVLQPSVATNADHLMLFEARGAKAEKARQVFAYVVAHSSDHSAKDVTTRYIKKHIWPGKTKGFRLNLAKIPLHDRRGRIRGYYEIDWWQSVMRAYCRPNAQRTIVDDIEDQGDLVPVQPEKKAEKEGVPDTLDGFKRSKEYVLARHLRREEALLPAAESTVIFKTGKGDKAIEEPVYLRKDVVICRTSESWHKEGRQVKVGEQALKMVSIRAVTATRKREIEEIERETGEKAMSGMYAQDQTEWIIPPPIKDGVIPKNAFGNMDAFVPQMIPQGAVHIPLRSTVRICKKLDIDYAEAVTGFEFGNRMAVPVIEGVVVASEHENLVMDAWEKAEEERQVREAVKQEKLVLGTWRKFLMGLRIMERMKDEYEITFDHNEVEVNPFVNQKTKQNNTTATPASQNTRRESQGPVRTMVQDTETVDGFVPEDDAENSGGFFAEDVAELGGGFIPEGQDVEFVERAKGRSVAPVSADEEFSIEHDDNDNMTSKPGFKGPIRSLAELAAARTAAEPAEDQRLPQDESASDEKPIKSLGVTKTRAQPKSIPAPTRRKSTLTKDTKVLPSSRRKIVQPQPNATDESDDILSDDLSEATSEQPGPRTPEPPAKPNGRSTRASARSAAKASQEKIRSHYFKSDSASGSDDAEGSEQETPVKGKRGKKSRA